MAEEFRNQKEDEEPVWLLTSGYWLLFDQVFLKHDQVIRVRRIPPNPHDVVAQLDREVDELALVVHALAADVFVAVILGPGLLGLLELAADTAAAGIGQHAPQPVVEHPRFE